MVNMEIGAGSWKEIEMFQFLIYIDDMTQFCKMNGHNSSYCTTEILSGILILNGQEMV